MKKALLTIAISILGFWGARGKNVIEKKWDSPSICFVENKGQIRDLKGQPAEEVAYYAHIEGVSVFFQKTKVSYVFPRYEQVKEQNILAELYRIDLELLEANSSTIVEAQAPTLEKLHYYLGAEPIESISSYQKIIYRNVYRNIDLVFYPHKGHLKYDFVIHPGGNPKDIKLRYNAGDSKLNIKLTKQGEVEVKHPLGKLIDEAPVVYQNNISIPAYYTLEPQSGVISFVLSEFDPSQDVIIDPLVRQWATFYGGNRRDRAFAVTEDAAGKITIAGSTLSTSTLIFPGLGSNPIPFGGETDAFIAQFDANGNRLWATYFGGRAVDQASAVAADASGNIYIVGSTHSNNLPGASNTLKGATDAFIASFTSTGLWRWSQYYGSNERDWASSIAAQGNILYIAGFATGEGLPAVNATQANFGGGGSDAFVAAFSNEGNLLLSTYYGGSGIEQAWGITVSSSAISIAGLVEGTSLPMAINAASGKRDAFIATWRNGALQWARYFGGSEEEEALALASDFAGNLYVTGSTKSINLPTRNAFDATKNGSTLSEDIYIASFNPQGDLRWSTYYGGTNIDKPTSIAVTSGRVYVVGSTNSADFPTTNNPGDYFQPLGGFYDAFLLGWDYEGQRKLAIVYGGTFMDQANSVFANTKGNIHIAGYTNSRNFPLQNPWQANYGDEEDAFLVSFQGDSPCANSSLQVNTRANSLRCAEDNSGSAAVFVSGGERPYIYQWRGPNNFWASTETIQNLSAGEYGVTVTDRNGCQAQATVSILQPSPIESSVTSTNLLCYGASNGAISVNVRGGVGIYSYRWQGPDGFTATTSNLTGLKAGTYTLVVTDGNGCRREELVTITQPSALALEDVVSENVSCHGLRDGKITISVTGGASPYSFDWQGPNGFRSTSQNLNGLAAGDYQGNITDANGCKITGTVTITQPEPLEVKVDSIIPVSCAGQSDGAIYISVSGGTAPYSYLWRKAPRFIDTTEDITQLGSGEYILVITDSKGCQLTRSFSVPENSALVVSLENITAVTCAGNNSGKLNITVRGGAAPYVFAWQGPNGFQANTEDLNDVAAGDYVLTVRDARNCTLNKQYTIPTPAPLVVTLGSTTNISCHNGSNGSIAINVTGGTEPYTFNWSGPNGFSSTQKDLTNLAVGTYVGKVTDTKGCSTEATVTLTQPLPLALEFSKQDISCSGRKDGRISITVGGGTPPYAYTWSGPDINPSAQALQVNLGAGEYVVEVTDANNCTTLRRNIQIIEPAPLIAIVQPTRVTCRGGRDGKIDLTVRGGTPPYTYTWTLPGGTTTNTEDLSNLVAGNYAFSVSDARNCLLAPGVVTVEDGTLLTIRIATDDPTTFCAGQSATLVAVASEPNVRYQWSTFNESGGGFISIDGATEQRFLASRAGQYKVSVENQEGCKAESEIVTIVVNTLPSVSITNPINELTICEGGSVTLRATSSTATAFEWFFNGRELGGGPTLVASEGGTYQVRVTDAKGCQNTAVAVLTVNRLPLARIRPPVSSVLCAPGDTLILEAETDNGIRFTWRQNGVIQPVSGLLYRMIADNLVLNASYNITVEAVDSNGCARTSDVQVVQVAAKPNVILNVTGPQRICNNQLQALRVEAGVAGTTYQWFRNEIPIPGANQNSFIPRNNGQYRVQVTSPLGCKAISSVIPVTIFSAPFLNLSSTGNLTYCSSQRPTILIVDNGNDSLTWFRNNQIVATNTRALVANVAGQYKVEVYDRVTGCKNDTTVQVRIIPAVAANAGNNAAICRGDSIRLEGSSTGGNGNLANLYRWAPATGLSNPSIARPKASPASTTIYTLTVTDSTNTCLDVSLVTITVNPRPEANISAENGRTVICQDGFARLLVTNPVPTNGYQWLKNGEPIPNANNAQFLVTELGIAKYSVKISNIETGCTSVSNEIEVTVHPKPSVQILGGRNICAGESVTLRVIENRDWQYQWYRNATLLAGQTKASLLVQVSGAYWVAVTNEFGCKENSDTSSITVFPIPTARAGVDVSICSNETTQLGTPAIQGINYSWVPPEQLNNANLAQPIFSPTQAGNYRFVLTVEANGCSSKDTVEVTVKPAPVVRIQHTTPLAFCQGGRVRLSSNITAQAYTWKLGGSVVGTSSTYTATQSGVYELMVETTNGCRATDTVRVTAYQAPIAKITATQSAPGAVVSDSTYCGNLPLTLSAFHASHLNGGSNSKVEYQWQFNGASISNAQQPSLANITQSGNYSVIITDTTSGCVAISRAFVVRQKAKANAGGDVIVCAGASGSLNAQTDGVSYRWRALTSGAPTLSSLNVRNPSFNADVAPGTYTYELTVENNTFCEPEKDTVAVIIKPLPTITTSKIPPLGCVQNGKIEVNVTTADAPFSYFLLDANNNILQQVTSSASSSAGFELLRAGIYKVRVVDGNSCLAQTLADTLFISAPRNLGLFEYVGRRNPDSTSIALRWDALAGNGITYSVRYRKQAEPEWILYDEGNPTNSLDVAQLIPRTTYEFQVQATCPNNDVSPWSSIFTATTDIVRPASCDTVRNLRVSIDADNSSAIVSWEAPLTAWDGATPVCYRLQLFENGTPKGGPRTVSNTRFEVPFLESGKQYTLSIITNCNNCAQPESQSLTHTINFSFSTPRFSGVLNGRGAAFELYPNPSNGAFHVIYEAQTEEPTILQVVDLAGKVIFNETFRTFLGENEYKVELSDYTSGIYLVRLKQGGRVATAKIMMN
ncbi:MAG: SBBP repeat-containing protein [Bacteroidia bacterium]|nr:SBBP repeat-containing protein [Bacteroidia bacterium]MDW8158370.1 SBBP repeat-containing protein [Bacteroidia bacterium]